VSHRLFILPRARLDEAEIYDYLADRSLAVAERFIDRVAETLAALCLRTTPGMRIITENAGLTNLRWTKVNDFPNHLIFFRLVSGRLEVVRILHGARDIEATLGE
jgi:toxin ParE1/3/4